MADPMRKMTEPEQPALVVEEEYQAWDWARTSGVSLDELRRAVEAETASVGGAQRRR